jgi:hypothetical protein
MTTGTLSLPGLPSPDVLISSRRTHGEKFLYTALVAPFKHWRVLTLHLCIGLMVFVFAAMFILVTLLAAKIMRDNSTTVVSSAYNFAQTGLDVLRLYRVGWNALSPLVPLAGGIWNHIYQTLEAMWLQARSFLCGTWPPTSIEADCPNLLELYGIFQDIVQMLQSVITLVTNLMTAIIDAVQPFLCAATTSSSTCSITLLDAVGWLLEWLVWFVSTFLKALSDVIYFIANTVASLTIKPGMDIQALVASIVANVNNLLRGLVFFGLNATVTIIDLGLCSALLEPLPCIIQPTCRFIFSAVKIPIPSWVNDLCFLGWCPLRDLLNLSVDLSQLCNALSSNCECRACSSFYGVGVPCMLKVGMNPWSNIGCRCQQRLTIVYSLGSGLLGLLGLYFQNGLLTSCNGVYIPDWIGGTGRCV